ncbi:glycosyltransferase family 4 protein [Microvirga pudoricolor]|uniref:glycosyltransferase family 4 protein n=1 Tax=Microvirga pudoricolor TaxID=2778729 RepID=UPI0019524D79|nr:glycosyltransferase family 4 protein [Microvirga pudoricolor]MBM6593247.1 glycosyltransferase family 4 protein [Microvirga pudoricolor]
MPETRLKVLHVVRQYPPSTGGLENYVQELSQRQSEKHDVAVLTLDRVFGSKERLPQTDRQGKVRIHRVPFIGWRRLFLPMVSRSFVKQYDIVHIHAADQLLDILALMNVSSSAKLFMTTHGLFFHTENLAEIKKIYLNTITRWSLGHHRAVFAVSGNDAKTLKTVGVDSVLLRNPIVPLGNFICEGNDLLYVGRLSTNKRIDALIEFMGHLKKTHPAIKLHLVGSDMENLWPELAGQVRQRRLEDNVFYHGFLDNDELSDLAKTCGFTVSASRYEGFGLSVVEGMSIGLLPFMHENAAFQETHALSGAGRLTNFDEPEAAARDFVEWLPRIRRQDREDAAAFAHRQSWNSVCDVYENYYGSVSG